MSSRSEIFGAIQALDKREIAHPGDFKSYSPTQNSVGDFKNSLSIVGAICLEVENKKEAFLYGLAGGMCFDFNKF